MIGADGNTARRMACSAPEKKQIGNKARRPRTYTGREAQALQQRIRDCRTPADVLAIVAVQGSHFDAIHSTTCLHWMAKMQVLDDFHLNPIFTQLMTV